MDVCVLIKLKLNRCSGSCFIYSA